MQKSGYWGLNVNFNGVEGCSAIVPKRFEDTWKGIIRRGKLPDALKAVNAGYDPEKKILLAEGTGEQIGKTVSALFSLPNIGGDKWKDSIFCERENWYRLLISGDVVIQIYPRFTGINPNWNLYVQYNRGEGKWAIHWGKLQAKTYARLGNALSGAYAMVLDGSLNRLCGIK